MIHLPIELFELCARAIAELVKIALQGGEHLVGKHFLTIFGHEHQVQVGVIDGVSSALWYNIHRTHYTNLSERVLSYRTAKYAYRAYPTAAQERWLAGAFGAMRVVYNDYLWQKERVYRGEQAELVSLDRFSKLPADRAWMRQYPQKCAEQARRQAETAYKSFFNGVAGRRADRPGKPRFKKKRAGGSLTWNGSSLAVEKISRRWAAVRLPKQGSWLRFRLSRSLPSKSSGVTLKLLPSGEYRLSFTVKQPIQPQKTSGPVAAVDLGVSDLAAAVSTDGSRFKVAAPRSYRRTERKIARLQKDLSRKQKGSKRQEKARLALAKQHQKVSAQRLHQAQTLASRLTSENQAVCLEKLQLKGLMKSQLAKSLHDAALGTFAAAVESAASKNGGVVLYVNPAYTTQTCSVCGVIGDKKPLSVREWACACGVNLDRDWNAAVNILKLAVGHTESLNDRGEHVRLASTASAVERAALEETVTSYKAHKPRRRRTRAKSLARRERLKSQPNG